MPNRHVLALFLLPALLSAYQLVTNGGFEKTLKNNPAIPQDWYLDLEKTSEATMTLDADNAASGKYSLKIDVTKTAADGKGKNALNHWKWLQSPLQTPATCDIALDLCAIDLKAAYIVFQAQDEHNKTLVWKNFKNLSGTFSWQRITASMDVPAGAKRINLSIRVTSTGTLWVDNASLDLKPRPNALKQQVLAFSGDILHETGLPMGWLKKEYTGNENVSVVSIKSQDGKTFAEQAWKTGAAHAGFTAQLPEQWIKCKAIQLSTEFRTLDNGKADFGLEYFDANGKSLGEAMAKDQTAKAWNTATFSFIPPHNAAKLAVVLNNTGMGTVHFASVTIAEGVANENAITLGAPALKVSCYPVKHSCDQQQVTFPEFNTFTDSPTKLTFHFSGDRKRMVKPTLCIDVPPEVTIPAAICPHPNVWCTEKFTTAPVKRTEGDYTRYTFVNVRGMQLAYPDERYQRRMVVVFTPVVPGTTFTGKKVFYHLENDGVPMPETAFNLNMLPPMPKTPNPKNFVFWRWNDEDFTWPGDELFLATLKCQEEANYTCISRYHTSCATRMKEVREIAAKRGWTLVARAGFNHHDTGVFQNIEKKHGIKTEYALRSDGKKMDGCLCPTFIACNPDVAQFRDDALRRDLKSRGVLPGEYMLLDSEEWSPMDWCFCERCRTYFAKLNNIAPVPDTATIKKNYAPQWRDFRTFLASRQIENNARVGKEFNLKIGDYNYVNDYTKPNYRDRYYAIAKDTLLNEQFQDMNLISYYHTMDALAFDMHKGERLKLKKPFIPICSVDGAGSYLSRAEVLTPQRFRLMILAAAVNGSGGYAIYPGERMDAKFYIAADKAMAEIAELEDILRNGAYPDDITAQPLPFKETLVKAGGKAFTITFPKWSDTFRYNIRELNGRKVVCILNFDTEHTAFAKITLDAPLNNRKVCEHTTHTSIILEKNTTSFLVEIPPRDAQFIEISSTAPENWPQYPNQDNIQKRFNAAAAAVGSQATALPKTWKKGEFNFSYNVDDNGNPMPVLANARQTIVVDAAHGGHIAQWTADGTNLCEQGQWLCKNRLWTPDNARGDDGTKRNSVITAATAKDGKATVTIENTFADAKVHLAKTFSISENSTAISVASTYRNDSDKDLSLIGWQHCLVNPGNAPNTLEHGDIQYTAGGKTEILPRNLLTVRLEAPSFQKLPRDDRKYDTSLKADSTNVRQLFKNIKKAIVYAPDPKHLSSYNCYNSIKASTVEWMYGAITLKPGQTITFNESIHCENMELNP